METMIQFAALTITTFFAVGAAVALDWVLLRAAFQMMQPATARQLRTRRVEPTSGARELTGPLAQQARL